MSSVLSSQRKRGVINRTAVSVTTMLYNGRQQPVNPIAPTFR